MSLSLSLPAPALGCRPLSVGRVALVILIALYFNDLLTAMTGLEKAPMRHLGTGVLMAASAGGLGTMLLRGDIVRYPFTLWPLALVGLFLTTSLISNSLFLPKSLGDWLPAHYVFMPVLLFYLLGGLRCTEREVFLGLVISGLIGGALMLAYHFDLLPFLEYYERRSIFGLDVRRMVVLKYEVMLALLALFAALLEERTPAWAKALAMVAVVVLLFLSSKVMQSRQALVAIMVSFVLLLAFDRRTFQHHPFLVRATVGLMVLLAVPFALANYLDLLGRDDLIESRELNVYVRIYTFERYFDLFTDTYGVGFGMSSPTGQVNNAIGANLAAAANFNDLELYGALFQFGIIGGLAALYLTLAGITAGWRAFRLLPCPHRWRPALLSVFLISGLLSPLPLNIFTQEWSMYFGGFALYLAWYYRVIASPAAHGAPPSGGQLAGDQPE